MTAEPIPQVLQEAGCVMEVVCPKKWHELDATEEPGIRFCADCRRLIFHARTASELRLAAQRGLCVYIAPGSPADPARRPAADRTVHRPLNLIRADTLRDLTGPTLGIPRIAPGTGDARCDPTNTP